MTIKELKPCPFCGGEAEIIKDKRWPRSLDHSIDAWHVECKNADCVIYQADNNYYRRRKEAIEHWNRRVGDNENQDYSAGKFAKV